MSSKRYFMIACRNIEDEIEAARKETRADYPILYLPSITHVYPQKMNHALQETIDRLTDIDILILPMGRCGNATIGLRSERFSIVLPKCEDCINLLISDDSLKVSRPRGHMFFTDGWLRNTMAVDKDYERAMEKYGKEECESLMRMMYGSYTHFALLNTGLYDIRKTKKALKPLAKITGIRFTEIDAPLGILKKMCALDFDPRYFAVIPPGVTVTEKMLMP